MGTTRTDSKEPVKGGRTNGWLALSPLAVFLVVYLVSSVMAGDFYSIPIASAFLIASCYAIAITPGQKGIEERIAIFSKGAGDRNVLLMIWIFVLAGAFASTAKDIGAIEATVNLTLRILPGNLLFAGIFIASCFISMSIGTSVGTIVALIPVTAGLAAETGTSAAFMAAIVTGGAFFGDNLSFISDTTIASTRTQGCSMQDKFRVNIMLAAPAAILVAAVYIFMGQGIETTAPAEPVEWFRLIPYILIIVLAVSGINVVLTLAVGGKRGAEFSIAALVSLANLCTANNTIAIITTGSMAKDITSRYGLDPRKSASILDTFSCIVQGFLPYGAQLLMASGLASVSAIDIIPHLYYPAALGAVSILAILFRHPKKYSPPDCQK